jgi:2-polyprenyl-6-methoxyphenol hydroxylase-like FAD-dependent oxidoreductase
MADVLIVGGGIAGSTLAILLARQGLTVELFEQDQFPKEKPCGEGLMPAGVAVLERMGLAETVGGVPFYGVRYHLNNLTAEGRFPETQGIPIAGRGQRRKHLDQILFQAASATPGVAAHTGTRVDRPLRENDRVVGIVVEGQPKRAKLVVAADGMHSRTRHILGLDIPLKRKRFGARMHFRLADRHKQPPWVDVFIASGYELYVTPLPDREILVAGLADSGVLSEPIEKTFVRWCSAQPLLAARLEGAEQVSSLQCIAPLAGRARCGVMPGVILLGDAACFLDPITGGGMAQALMTAELLSSYMLDGAGNHDRWIWAFERKRQALLRDYRLLTQSVLWLACHPKLGAKVLALLRMSPSLLSHFIGVAGGVRQLFSVSGAIPCQAARFGSM